MKTQLSQIITIVGFFTMSLTTTLTISWAVSGLFHAPAASIQAVEIVQPKTNSDYQLDLNKSFKLLVIPKNPPRTSQ
ncbi:hypothetical protein MNBD_GAMMA01-1839 [hydrothermal vent metagenome]|uniref:Uncharacterized protein n=1 Tax=hydrothermal vent metagenome TaxID=652676 RepID=A0A3B0VEF0_9ZZZZ